MWRRTIDNVEVVPVDLPVRRLPEALSGLVACQISDFHVDREEDLARLQQAVDTINRQDPDFVFLTGDYFSGPDTMRRYIDDFRRALKNLTPRHGVFSIAGNHDHWSSFGMISEALRGAGARVFANQHERLKINGESVVIVGIDDLWSRRAEPSRAFQGLKPDDCTIVLAHNHPSGDPSPSREDIEMTKEIKHAANALSILLHDHVIVGNGQWLSFRKAGLL